jgi:hypothetical protein
MTSTTPTERITLHIGGDDDDAVDVTLRPFKGTKGVYAGAIIAEVSDEAKAMVRHDADFRRTYGETNRRRITEDVAIMRGWEIPDSKWHHDTETGERFLELPATPSDEERFMELFRMGFQLARRQVAQLVALVLADDEELFEVEDQGGDEAVLEFLAANGKALLRKATVGEIIDVAWAAFEQTRIELESRGGKLRGLRGLFSMTRSSGQTPPAAPAQPDPSATESTPETSRNESLDSSTTSPAPTAGTDAPSSTAGGGS